MSHPSPLLRLPRELRDMILSHLLPPTYTLHPSPTTPTFLLTDPTTNLPHTNRQLRHEYHHLLLTAALSPTTPHPITATITNLTFTPLIALLTSLSAPAPPRASGTPWPPRLRIHLVVTEGSVPDAESLRRWAEVVEACGLRGVDYRFDAGRSVARLPAGWEGEGWFCGRGEEGCACEGVKVGWGVRVYFGFLGGLFGGC
ncbi:hypothetical protein Tdes44962_MAKER10165 [Teratosphaeria destructans]|uniref:F-box domain-containing protein n=1 Tax=Teratosphaeria destructans TaxID=418781 RepID=A0A9W7SNS4_9PEZI|nr:hypothetical protein Tdes44962_MAKER10165 [Teratosphaeria destructans]